VGTPGRLEVYAVVGVEGLVDRHDRREALARALEYLAGRVRADDTRLDDLEESHEDDTPMGHVWAEVYGVVPDPRG
jgi:hypothetical protein